MLLKIRKKTSQKIMALLLILTMVNGMVPGFKLGVVKVSAASRLVNDGGTGTVTFGTLSTLTVAATTMTAYDTISALDNLSTGFDVYGKNGTSTKLMIRNMTGAGAYTGASGAFVQLIGTTSGTVEYMDFHGSYGVFDLDSLKLTSADNTYSTYDFTIQALDNSFNPIGAPVLFTGVNKQQFTTLDVSNNVDFDGIYGFRVTVNQGCQICVDDISVNNPRVPATPADTVTVSAVTQTPTVGSYDEVTLIVNDSTGNIDTTFNGVKNVTLSGYTAAPNDSYGSFNGTDITALSDPITVNFINGVATANLELRDATQQNIVFNIEGVNNPLTSPVVITPSPAAAATMLLNKDISAPVVNGGQFTQQPEIILEDIYGNVCKNDSDTIVTVSRNDGGEWILTGDTSAKANSGIINFNNLGAKSEVGISGVQLSFSSIGCSSITSGLVSIPEPPNITPTFIESTTALIVNQNANPLDITSFLHVSDTDSGQTLIWAQSVAPNHGGILNFSSVSSSISGSSDIGPQGIITYTPAYGYHGSETFTVEVSDGHAVTTKTITVTVENKKPIGNNLSIAGTKTVGETLTADYTYADAENDEEGDSIYKWYRADNDQGLNKTEINGETSKSYTVKSQDEEKYISFEVVPTAKTGTIYGDAKSSPWIKINDVTPPNWESEYPSVGVVTKDSIELKVKTNEDGNAYFVCLPKGSVEPMAIQVKNGQDGEGDNVDANHKGTVTLSEGIENKFSATLLTAGTEYDIYIVAEDKVSNLQTSAVKVSRTTSVVPITDFTRVAETATTVSFSWSSALWSTSIMIEQSPIDSENWTVAETSLIKGDAITAKVTGLLEDTEYKFRLVVTGGANAGISNVEAVKTDKLPYVSSVSAPTNSVYTSGENLDFIVNYSEAVNVSGIPKIAIVVGDTTKYASYVSNPSSTAMMFRYTVENGDFDENGIEISNNILINGGKITNSHNENAKLTLKNVESTLETDVDAKGSKINSVGTLNSGVYKTGDKLEFLVKFDENVVVTGNPYLNVTIGSERVKAEYKTGSGTANIHFSYTLLSGDNDDNGIELDPFIILNGGSIEDNYGNSAVDSFNNVDTSNVLVDAISPTLTNSSMSSDKKEITLTFSENILDATTDNTLKDAVRFSSNGGVDYIPLGNDSLISINGKELKIRFSTALTGSKNRIKVAKKYLKDIFGNIQEDEIETNNLGASINAMEDEPLTEENLNGRTLMLTVDGDAFKDSTLDKNNFILNNAPKGASVEGVSYIDNEHCQVLLGFDGRDFDLNVENLSVKIDSSELGKNQGIISNELTIISTNDAEFISTNNEEIIKEGEEDSKVITVTITGGQFESILNANNWTVTNLPLGVTKGTVTRVNDTTAQITLSGNSIEDYDSDVKNITVSCTAEEYTDSNGGISLSANTGVNFIAKTIGTVTTLNSVKDIKYTKATVQGKVISTGNGVISERGVIYSTSINPEIGDEGVTKVVVNEVSIDNFKTDIAGLTPNTTYHVRAFIKNEEGISYGEDVSFRTEAVPSPIIVSGKIIDKDGSIANLINVNVIAEVDETYTINFKSENAIEIKNSDGTRSSINDYSKLSFTTDSISNISISAEGKISANNLEKGKSYEYKVTYDLNGEKVVMGTIIVDVSANGNVNLTSTLIDPYGVITDSTSGKIIEGVSVTLYYANTDRNKLAGIVPDTEVKLPIVAEFKSNNKNPQVSDDYGAYAFLVYPNTDYYVVGIKDGYDKYVSPTISVEKEIVKFDLKMNSKNSNGADKTNVTDEIITNDVDIPQTGSPINAFIFIVGGIVSISVVFGTSRKKKINKA